jgi:glycosyltransferase involved in cell wall biosynthesis
MIENKKIVVVLPAYNAELTLRQTYNEIPFDIVDEIVLVDDKSSDRTTELAREIGIRNVIRHEINKGYGGNQKTCYDTALALGGDIVIMLHPDYQYDPRLIHSMAFLIAKDVYKVVLGSRILGNGALRGGMPVVKYVSNRLLTFFQNLITGQKLSEYHTGYRAFSAEVLRSINYHGNSDNYVFDNQLLCQIIYRGYEIAEITCPTKYFKEASSINLKNSFIYAVGVLKTSLLYFLSKTGIYKSKIFMD